ncbi:MAG: hypothetical protein ACMUHU_00845 [Thermoplasmatota archaeon]
MRSSLERTRLRKIGNGQGVLLSSSVCRLMGMSVGSYFRIDIEGDKLVLIPAEGSE